MSQNKIIGGDAMSLLPNAFGASTAVRDANLRSQVFSRATEAGVSEADAQQLAHDALRDVNNPDYMAINPIAEWRGYADAPYALRVR